MTGSLPEHISVCFGDPSITGVVVSLTVVHDDGDDKRALVRPKFKTVGRPTAHLLVPRSTCILQRYCSLQELVTDDQSKTFWLGLFSLLLLLKLICPTKSIDCSERAILSANALPLQGWGVLGKTWKAKFTLQSRQTNIPFASILLRLNPRFEEASWCQLSILMRPFRHGKQPGKLVRPTV